MVVFNIYDEYYVYIFNSKGLVLSFRWEGKGNGNTANILHDFSFAADGR